MNTSALSNGPASAPKSVGHVWPRWRVWAIRVCYGLLSLLTLAMSHGVVDLLTGQAGPGFHYFAGAVTAFKFLAVGGVFVICWTGGRSVLAFQALVVGQICWLVSPALFAVQPTGSTPVSTLFATAAIWFGPLILFRPNRRDLFRLDAYPSAILLPLALAATVPLAIYAVHQGNNALDPTEGAGDPWRDMCGLGLVLAAQAVFAALRPRGTRWLPRLVALAAAWVGTLALIWPHDHTSPGAGLGAALVGWAVVFAVGAEFEARRSASLASRLPGPNATSVLKTG